MNGSKGQKNYNRGVELISAINIQFIFKSIFFILSTSDPEVDIELENVNLIS